MTDEAEGLRDFMILEDRLIDSVEIRYATWAHLQFTKLVDVYKYDHLKLVPKSLFEANTDLVVKTIWTIINHKGALELSHIMPEFQRATGFQLSDFFEVNERELETFISQKKEVFSFNRKRVSALKFDEKAVFGFK